jgi:glutathione S-transferase
MSAQDASYVFYGAPHSLYSAKARSYLRKQGVAYRECMPAHPDFAGRILPQIRRSIIPVLETPSGEIIQDSIDIIDYFERRGARCSAYPTGPRQHALALWVEYYGSFSLLRHAMHYRWSFLDQQRAFLTDAFVTASGGEAAATIMQRMQSYLPGLGVSGETIALIEASFERLLDILEVHFAEHPYLFGGQPSIGDYGLIGSLFAHLGRDPVPAGIMKTRAPKVFRWVERMNACDPDMPEFGDREACFLANDEIPITLAPLWQHMAEEIFPELSDKLAFLDGWVAEKAPVDGEPVSAKPHQRHVGAIRTQFRGVDIQAGVDPYLICQLRRIDAGIARLVDAEQVSVRAYLQSVGLPAGLTASRSYSVARRNNLEVWEIPPATAVR